MATTSQEYLRMFDPEQLKSYPQDCGVYLMKDSKDHVIYVGKAKNLRVRLRQYFDKDSDKRAMIPFLISKIAKIDTIITPSDREALLLENNLIKKHQPKYNALLKDDKTFVSLLLTKEHKWPMLKLIRYKGAPPKKGLVFGPYTSSLAAKDTLELISKIFPLRQCSDRELSSRTRPCILHAMQRCIAPCTQKCTKEEYDLFVDKAVQFLQGKDSHIVEELKSKMEEASEKLEYEKAAAILHTIGQIKHVIENRRSIVQTSITDCDVIGLYRQSTQILIAILSFRNQKMVGSDHFVFSMIAQDDDELLESFLLQHYPTTEDKPKEILLKESLANKETLAELLEIKITSANKKEKRELIELAEKNAKNLFYQEKHDEELKETLLQEMQEKLSLSNFPIKIECIDTSNISAAHAVASLITFVNGAKHPQGYRTYKIKGDKFDDYHAMKEVLLRRYHQAKETATLPDLIIVDGGKGQLSIALEVLEKLDIASCDVIALAKEDSRHDKGLSQEKIFIPSQKDPIIFDRHSPVLFLLQQIRDEAHRKAITFHRKKRSQALFASELDALPGIGAAKKKKLLSHFGSVKRLKSATQEEIEELKGFSQKDKEVLWKFIKP